MENSEETRAANVPDTGHTGHLAHTAARRRTTVIAWTALVAGISWALSGALFAYLTYTDTVIPSGLVRLVSPETIESRVWHSIMPWVLVIPIASTLTLMGLVTIVTRWVIASDVTWDVTQQRRLSPVFLALWLDVALSSFVTSALWSIGVALIDWPPVRISYLINDLAGHLTSAGYFGLVWGWLPALVAVLILRRQRSRATSPSTRQPRSVRHALFHAAFVTFTVALAAFVVVSAPLSSAAIRDAQNAEMPAPAPTVPPVTYGSPDVASANQPPGDAWCGSDQVVITPGGSDSATGHRALSIDLVNTSTTPCVLDGYPDVAFDDQDGNAMDPLLVHGGSFSTTDAGRHEITLAPGAAARALLGWNAMSAAGDDRAGTMLVAPYAGALRQSSPVDLDILSSGAVAVTAWELVSE